MDWDRGAVSGAKSIAGSMGLSDRSGIHRNLGAWAQADFNGQQTGFLGPQRRQRVGHPPAEKTNAEDEKTHAGNLNRHREEGHRRRQRDISADEAEGRKDGIADHRANQRAGAGDAKHQEIADPPGIRRISRSGVAVIARARELERPRR